MAPPTPTSGQRGRGVAFGRFDLPRNEILGVVGVNGAKSTLLRVIAGILPPTTGRVEIYGQVSTLLALGLGFNKT